MPLGMSPGGVGVGAGGVLISLIAASCGNQQPGGSSCSLRCVRSGISGAGTVEHDSDDAGYTFDHNAVTPPGAIGGYQMKWESNTGLDPNGGSAKSTWIDLSTTTFSVTWTQSGVGDRTGSINVSIRKGTGPTLKTVVWDGEAIGEKTGK